MERPGDIEVNLGQPESPRNPNRLDVGETVCVFFPKALPVVNVLQVLTFMVKMEPHKLPIGSMSSIVVYMTCLLLSFVIHLVMIWVGYYWIKHVRRRYRRWRWKIVCLSSFLQISAATALVLFLDTHHAVVELPVFFLILVIVLRSYCWFCGTSYFGYDNDPPGLNWGGHTEQLQIRFHMSAMVVSMAFGGLSGKVLGFNKGSSVPTGGYTAVALAPEYILFYSLVLGLLVLLVCTVPPRVRLCKDRDSMATVHLRVVTYAALSLLVLASVVAALGMKQVQNYVFFECIAIAFVALIFYCYERHSTTADRRTDSGPRTPAVTTDSRPQDLRKAFAMYTNYLVPAYFTSLFAAIMASHSKYGMESGSTVPLSPWFKGFVLSAVGSVLSFTIHIVLQAEMPYTRSWVLSRKACSGATIGATVTTAFAFLVGCLRTDEFKSIF